MVLSTLADLQDNEEEILQKEQLAKEILSESVFVESKPAPAENSTITELKKELEEIAKKEPTKEIEKTEILGSEKEFLEKIKLRLLVLFEGLSDPATKAVDAKVDLIINFLEYHLAMIEERLAKSQK